MDIFKDMPPLPEEAFVPNGAAIERKNITRVFNNAPYVWVFSIYYEDHEALLSLHTSYEEVLKALNDSVDTRDDSDFGIQFDCYAAYPMKLNDRYPLGIDSKQLHKWDRNGNEMTNNDETN